METPPGLSRENDENMYEIAATLFNNFDSGIIAMQLTSEEVVVSAHLLSQASERAYFVAVLTVAPSCISLSAPRSHSRGRLTASFFVGVPLLQLARVERPRGCD